MNESSRFAPVAVDPAPCSDEQRRLHMESFVRAFVIPPRRPRAKLLLVDGSGKLRAELSQLVQKWLITSKCSILEGNESFPSQLAARFGDQRGVFVASDGGCCMLTAPMAATVATMAQLDAVFSLIPGRAALAFHHGGAAMACTLP